MAATFWPVPPARFTSSSKPEANGGRGEPLPFRSPLEPSKLYYSCFPRHCAGIHPVGFRLYQWFGIPRKLLRHQVDLRVQGVAPFNDFARVRRHATEDRGHGAVCAIFGFAVGFIIANGIEQVVVLLLIRILPAFTLVTPRIGAANHVTAD